MNDTANQFRKNSLEIKVWDILFTMKMADLFNLLSTYDTTIDYS